MDHGVDVGLAQYRVDLLFDEFGIAFLDHEDGLFAGAEAKTKLMVMDDPFKVIEVAKNLGITGVLTEDILQNIVGQTDSTQSRPEEEQENSLDEMVPVLDGTEHATQQTATQGRVIAPINTAEPEPPSLPGVGPSPWYGRLIDDINAGRFQQAAIVCTALMVMNLLLIPMLINKYKEQKIKVKRKSARAKRLADSDEFADDLEDFFD